MDINNFLMLNVGFASHRGDWNFNDVSSPFTRIYYVTAGEATVRIGATDFHLTPGHMYLIPAFTVHSEICDGLFEHYYVHVYEEVKSGDNLISSYDFPLEIDGREIDRILFETLVQNNETMRLRNSDPRFYDNETSLIECVRFNRSRPIDVRFESMGIIAQFLGRFLRYARPRYNTYDERVRHALRVINSSLHGQLPIDRLAQETGMSTGHFIRLFKTDLGCTPTQFLIDRKLMKAKLMLASESMMMKEIAYTLGYDDVSYFIRLFKKHTGMTPRQYRQSFNHNLTAINILTPDA